MSAHLTRAALINAAPVVHVIDDDEAVRDALAILLRTYGFAARSYSSAEAFLDAPAPGPSDCIISDVQMPRLDGLELLSRLKRDGLTLPVIVMSGRGSRRMAEEAVARGAWGYVDKPFASDQIVEMVQDALAAA